MSTALSVALANRPRRSLATDPSRPVLANCARGPRGINWAGTLSLTLAWLCAGGCAPAVSEPAPTSVQQPQPAGQAFAPLPVARFISCNVPNLHYIEDNWRFEERSRYRLPTPFEIRDALLSIKQMGARVVRIYTLSVRKPDDPPEVPRHVLAPGRFNEAAFVALDRVLQIAAELDVRLIIPLVDNWQWWGGVAEYARFRGKPSAQFWTDPQLIADFEQTIAYVVGRRNTLTGTLYREDDTIFAWETGNELVCPYAWTERIAATLKRLDPTHSVIDGSYGPHIRPEALVDPNIDLVSTHHYAAPEVMVEQIATNIRRAAGIKPYFIGEFGFIPTPDVERVLDTVIQDGALGALLWSLRFHNRDGGFYWHDEKSGYQAYHWPGFDPTERNVLHLLRRKAYEIRGEPLPELRPPAPPRMLPIDSPAAISWRGSAGATSYVVERARTVDGPWQVVGREISDAALAYRPLFADPRVEAGRPYYYRVRAQNRAGKSRPSDVVGPVSAACRQLIDELVDLSQLHAHHGRIDLRTDRPHWTRMDQTRVEGQPGSALVYGLQGTIERVKVYAFLTDPSAAPSFDYSTDGAEYQPLAMHEEDFFGGPDQPPRYHPVLFSTSAAPATGSFLRVSLAPGAQIGRVEICYSPSGG